MTTTREALAERTFTLEDQRWFAELAGDHNPLHVDPTAARRLLFGRAVVHGIHSLVWALDVLLADAKEPVSLGSLKADFFKPIGVGELARLELVERTPDGARLEITVDDVVTTKVKVSFGRRQEGGAAVDPVRPAPESPLVLSEAEVAGRSGQLALHLDSEALGARYPHLERALPAVEVATLLASTRLVGSRCPGLHSVYSALRLDAKAGGGPALEWSVGSFHERYKLTLIDFTAPGLRGAIEAFVRPSPREQLPYGAGSIAPEQGEFSGQRALVVGGSRGLGEVTAKCLCAGGADVRVTHHSGSEDARRLVDEVSSAGGSIGCLPLDVTAIDAARLLRALDGFEPTQLYYFATPPIFVASKGQFSERLFERFSRFYVTGFMHTVAALRPLGLEAVFCPSSVALDELPPDMVEYVAAKTAGEAVCAALRESGLFVLDPRLPRLRTDQTASIVPMDDPDPTPVMLEHVRALVRQGG